MRVIVCGGRKYNDWVKLVSALSRIDGERPFRLVINGGQTGADALAAQWAKNSNIPVLTFQADWTIGKVAGPIRNRRMIDEGKPDLVIAFPGGPGTANMIKQAKASGIEVIEIFS